MNRFRDQFPSVSMGVPNLTPEAVTRYQQLGEQAKNGLDSGDLAETESLLRQQIEIYPHNPEPYLGLVTLACRRGSTKEALNQLCEAVGRGQLDLEPIEDSDHCLDLLDLPKYEYIYRSLSYLRSMDKRWSQWESFQTDRVPESVAEIDGEVKWFTARIEKMAPALGPRLTEKWKRWFECAEVILHESYVAERPRAKDFNQAVTRLMELYEKEELFQWRYRSPQTAERLARVAENITGHFPEQRYRAETMMLKALSEFSFCSRRAMRQRRPGLLEKDYEEVRSILQDVAQSFPDSPRAFDASLGLVQLALRCDRNEEAGQVYRGMIERYADDLEQQDRIHDSLKSRALYVKGLPEFSAETLDGQKIESAALEGDVILLDFWASWCLPCLDELTKLRKLHQQYGDKGFRIVGVNLDEETDMDAERLRQWLAEKKVTWPQVRDGKGWESEFVKLFAIEEVPFTVLVDSKGKVLAVNYHDDRLRRAVKQAVKEARS